MKPILSAAIVALALSLGACAPGVSPPAMPTPTSVGAEATQINATDLTPDAFWKTGIALANTSCLAYFNGLTIQSDNMGLAQQETNIAGGVASGAAGLAGAGTPVAAGLGLLFPAISQSFTNFATAQTGGLKPAAVYQLVLKAQNAYLASVPSPQDLTTANMYLTGYAALCEPVQVQAFALEAALNSTPSTTGGSNALLRANAASPTGIVPPPVVHFP